MIQADQPNCFDEKLGLVLSSVQDGQMQCGWQESGEVVKNNIKQVLERVNFNSQKTIRVQIEYSTNETYDRVDLVTENHAEEAIYSDCLMTNCNNVALYLPVADCIATVFYDPLQKVVALAHLGRHSTIARLAEKTIQAMKDNFSSDPKDIIVWMSPSIKSSHYLLGHAEFAEQDDDWKKFCLKTNSGYALDMQGFNQSRLLQSGVRPENIHISPINTADSDDYWSHYMSVTVKGETVPPRFMVAAWLKP